MFLDIAAAIAIALLIAHWFGVHAGPALVLLTILFALLPDIDFVPYLWQKWHRAPQAAPLIDHRSYTHYPLLYLPLFALLYLAAHPLYTTLVTAAICFHLVHDTVGPGWGVSWLWPFTERRYRFFPAKDGRITAEFFISWSKAEEPEIYKRYGGGSGSWVRDYYLRPNLVAYVEYGSLLLSLLALWLYWR